jgi:hypothetical protein
VHTQEEVFDRFICGSRMFFPILENVCVKTFTKGVLGFRETRNFGRSKTSSWVYQSTLSWKSRANMPRTIVLKKKLVEPTIRLVCWLLLFSRLLLFRGKYLSQSL